MFKAHFCIGSEEEENLQVRCQGDCVQGHWEENHQDHRSGEEEALHRRADVIRGGGRAHLW